MATPELLKNCKKVRPLNPVKWLSGIVSGLCGWPMAMHNIKKTFEVVKRVPVSDKPS